MKKDKSNKDINIIKSERAQKSKKIFLNNNSNSNKNLINMRYKNNLTKFSNEIIDDAINNSIDKLIQMSNKNQLKQQNLKLNNEKLNDGDKIVSEFILKNNPFSNDNISNKIVEDKSSLGQFLKRDKMFQDKLKSNKEKMIRDKNDELLLQISTKPKMNEKSRRIIKEKMKKNKEHIKYSNPNQKNEQLINNTDENNSNKIINNNINTNVNDDIMNIKKRFNFVKKSSRKNLEINNVIESNKIRRVNSENNIKITKLKEKPKLTEGQINRHLKISKSYKFIYVNRVKKKYDFDTLIKFNKVSSAVKMKKLEINKINEEIKNLCSKKINFYCFCELLFHFGLVNIKHEKQNIMEYKNIDKNDEILDNLLIRTYFDENLITKEFVINEFIIIKKAFKSIHENFNIKKYEPIKVGIENNEDKILSDVNYTISIQNFKLFIFIMLNLFEGLNEEDIINLNRTDKLVEEENKNNINKENEIKNDEIIIYDLIKKITLIKNIEKFTSNFINEYKSNFYYMIKSYQNYKIIFDYQKKEINNKRREEYLKNEKIPEFSFNPKINKEKDINYIKMNKDLNFDNNESKAKKVNDYKEKLDQFTFKPKINKNIDLKKIFENPLFTNHLSVKKKPNKIFDTRYTLKFGIDKNKNNIQDNKEQKDLINKSKDKGKTENKNKINNIYDFTFKNDLNNLNSLKEDNENNKTNKNKIKINNQKKINKSQSQSKPYTQRSKKSQVKSVIVLQIKNAENKSLIIDPTVDYKEVINNFCLENNLDGNQYKKILDAVRNRIAGNSG